MEYLNFIVVFISLSLTPVRPSVRAQSAAHAETERLLDNAQVGADIHVKEEVPLALADLLRGTGLTGGVAEEIGCSAPPEVQLDVRQGTTVRTAMDAFAAENPGYRWIENAGVVNVTPANEFPLLRARIRSFELETTETARAVLFNLLNIPEVRQRAAELNLKPGLIQGWAEALPTASSYPKAKTPIHLSLQDVSLQEAFNSVVRFYGRTIWIYDERQCNGERTYLVRATEK